MFCRKCGKEIPDDSDFCLKCGVKVVLAEERSTPTVSEPAVQRQSSAATAVLTRKTPQPYVSAAAVTLTKEPPKSIAGIPICEKCGKPVPRGNMFCPNCGENLPRMSPTEAPSPKAPPAVTSRKCDGCGELVYNNQRSCHNCGATNRAYDSRFEIQQSTGVRENFDPTEYANNAFRTALQKVRDEEERKNANTPEVLVSLVKVTKIICYAALALALFFELVIADNISINSMEDINTHNVIIIISYFFWAIFFCGLVIRIICACIICSKRGEMGGVFVFLFVGTIIAVIVGAITKTFLGAFALFGLIAVGYISSKIKDYM